jgi:hypothetical protein
VSPLLRPDMPSAQGRCRVHGRPLVPAPRLAPGELDAASALAEQAREALRSNGIEPPTPARQRPRNGYCPDCVQGLAEAAHQRLAGPEEPPLSEDLWAELNGPTTT